MNLRKTGDSRKILLMLMIIGIVIIIAGAAALIFNAVERGRSQSENIVDLGEDKLVSAFFKDHSAVVGFSSNKIEMLDPEGKVLWSFATQGSVKALALSDEKGLVYAACESGEVFCLDKNGNAVAQVKVRGRAMNMYYSKQARIITVANGVGVTSQKFYITTFNEQLEMMATVQTFMDTYACAVTSDGQMTFYGTKDSRIGAIGANGAVLWEVDSKYAVRSMELLESEKLLIVTDEKGYVYAVSYGEKKGRIVWTYQMPDAIPTSVAVDTVTQVIIVGESAGYLHTLDYNGSYLTKRLIGSGAINAISIDSADQSIYGTCGTVLFRTDEFINKANADFNFAGLGTAAMVTGALLFIVFFFLYLYRQNERARETMHAMSKGRAAYLMLLPTFALLFVFVYYPIASGFISAFTNWSPFRQTAFVGFDNFKKMASDVYIWTGLKNMLLLTFTGLLKTLIMPMIAALLIVHLVSDKLRYIYRTGFVLTTIVPGVAAALMWQMMLDPNIGLINNLLRLTGLGQYARAWLGEEQLAIWAIIFIGFPWIGIFPFLVYYGGFIGINSEIYDSSKIDGANAIKRFFRIELPLITPQIKMLLLLGLIGGLQDYQGILLITRGGPGRSTYVPALEVFFNVSDFGEYGYASAIGLMLFVFILIVSLIILRIPTVEDN